MGSFDWAAVSAIAAVAGLIVMILIAWIGHLHRRVHHGLTSHDQRFSRMAIDYMPREQVNERLQDQREMVKDGFSSIESKLDKIFEKLDGKADK